MCDNGPDSLPPSLHLLDQLRTPGSPLRSQLCVAVSTISRRIAKEQQRALTQVCPQLLTPGLRYAPSHAYAAAHDL